MSFSLPRNVPAFENPQRPYEDGLWSRAPHHNGHANAPVTGGPPSAGLGHGIGSPLRGVFEKKELPMYKDKPYSYAKSGRRQGVLGRKRVWFGILLLLLGAIVYYTGVFGGSKEGAERTNQGASKKLWDWGVRKGSNVADWNERREKVREVFELSWDGYARYAWGQDEYYPMSKRGRQMTPTGMGWIIVDALDTLMIMNLTSRLSDARRWMTTSLAYDQDHEVNTFETTIRMLGGLLSAHYLSTTYPDMAPQTDDDYNQPGEDLYLEKAADLADRLSGAFESGSGVPYASVNLKTLKGKASHADGGASSTAEAASLQLEMKYLAMLTGESSYWERAERVIQVIDDNGMEDGLLPIFIYADQGTFRGDNIRLGSRGDSYYEYLIKQYLQTSQEEPIYLALWDQALAGIRKHLITYSHPSHFTVLAERPNGIHQPLSPKMDHLVCFMPGTIALAATEGLPLSEARKSGSWSQKKESEMLLARELTKTCWGMYKAAATGLAPEITYFNVEAPPRMESAGLLTSAEMSDSSTSGNVTWKDDFVIKNMDSHNLQRPETVETLFYMYRITGDDIYREWGWEMFKSFVEYTAVADGAGFTSLSKANELPPIMKDNMESFWLAETLKYFYLLFSPPSLLPLSEIVINTEAHIFPRFKLQRGLKTGWQRKPRDENGNIVSKGSGENGGGGDGEGSGSGDGDEKKKDGEENEKKKEGRDDFRVVTVVDQKFEADRRHGGHG